MANPYGVTVGANRKAKHSKGWTLMSMTDQVEKYVRNGRVIPMAFGKRRAFQ